MKYSWEAFLGEYDVTGMPLVEVLEKYHPYAIDEVLYKLQQCQDEKNAILKTIQLLKESK